MEQPVLAYGRLAATRFGGMYFAYS